MEATLASPEEKPEEQEPDGEPSSDGRLARAREWAAGNPRRTMIIGVGFALISITTIAGWLIMASYAVQPETVTIEQAIQALDDGEDELAQAIVIQMQEQILPVGEYGGPLFVLGVLKSKDADRQWSADRKRSEYFIASKYLSEAKTIGFPEGREAEGLYLLGKSLIESRQLSAGVEVLLEALKAGVEGSSHAHYLLAEAYFYAPKPRYADAIAQLDLAVQKDFMTTQQRANALLLRAEALSAIGKTDEANASVREAGDEADPARRQLIKGLVLVAKLEATPEKDRSGTLASQATEALKQARRLDKLSTDVSRESDYYLAKTLQITGRTEEAIAGYAELRRSHGRSPAGIAAALAEGDMLQIEKNGQEALEAYRRALEAIEEPSSYRSGVLSLSKVRQRIRYAHQSFLNARHYEYAFALANRLTPLFPRKQQLDLRAQTLRLWGDNLLEQAKKKKPADLLVLRKGRKKLREAGMAYEQLAEARFASRQFVDDLWEASSAYLKGQSYSSASRVLDRYLRNEPEQRNALALLRLGEAHLATNQPQMAIDAFLECLEFHPDDGSSYQARLECARAYRLKGEKGKAENLLRHNLMRTDMTPSSPEWRDSLFALGRLLVEEKKHLEGINTLTEAIDRYPTNSQRRQALYLMAEAYRNAAQEPLQRLAEAITVNDREQARAEARGLLEKSLGHYEIVQREITLAGASDELDRITLRNCFMLGGTVLFDLGRYKDAIKLYQGISTLYQNEPFMLESLVQISHCWRRLKDSVRSAGAIQQAKGLLDRLPSDTDFATSTNLSRTEWGQLLDELAQF